MISIEEIEKYLPKYLSPESQKNLFNELGNFPDNIDKRMYTSNLDEKEVIFQGDGLRELLVLNLPDTVCANAKAIIISNTCDVDQENKRYFPSRLCYTPLFSLRKYEEGLRAKGIYSAEQLSSHIETIKNQKITQIFYLPASDKLEEDSIAFFDRLHNCDNNFVHRNELKEKRLFTLSDYGLYLFLFKLSIHFTRIQEGIERGSVKVA
jgi:hypothetical protein